MSTKSKIVSGLRAGFPEVPSGELVPRAISLFQAVHASWGRGGTDADTGDVVAPQ